MNTNVSRTNARDYTGIFAVVLAIAGFIIPFLAGLALIVGASGAYLAQNKSTPNFWMSFWAAIVSALTLAFHLV